MGHIVKYGKLTWPIGINLGVFMSEQPFRFRFRVRYGECDAGAWCSMPAMQISWILL